MAQPCPSPPGTSAGEAALKGQMEGQGALLWESGHYGIRGQDDTLPPSGAEVPSVLRRRAAGEEAGRLRGVLGAPEASARWSWR